jgi:hypothetical protein
VAGPVEVKPIRSYGRVDPRLDQLGVPPVRQEQLLRLGVVTAGSA